MNTQLPVRLAGALVASLTLLAPVTAQKHKELGRMWPLENVPLNFFESEYDFKPTAEWMQHAMAASLRFGRGCSASFVSPKGLIMTNHHCARSNVDELSPEGEDWLGTGYFAKSAEEEVAIPGLTVQQLVATKDITAEVKAGADPKEFAKAAKEEHPDLQHQIVRLYQGGMYQIYSYKIWDDIRLVATPQLQSAKFGGDPDNFTYPRYSLDYTFVRAYVDGKPADTSAHYFKFRTEGPQDGELAFVIGNPGTTGRLKTVAQVEFMRDMYYPAMLQRVHGMLDQLNERSKESEEQAKSLRARILSVENTRKAFQGYLDGLRNERILDIKRKAEKAIRAAVDADPELKEKYAGAWTRLEEIAAQKRKALETGEGRGGLSELEAEEKALEEKIGEAFFAVYGTEIPPDATFTLRISDGIVKGFPYNGTVAPFSTSLFGLYARHTEFAGVDPFNLPEIWLKKMNQLDMTTPFNLVATCDIIGGNSGSPMIDRDQRVIGLVFDGNIEMLGNNYVFDDEVARTVCVHPAIIIESLRKVYDAAKLADEIEGKKGYL